jgi:hypothetical protein
LGSIGVTFLVKGRGHVLGSNMFPQAGHGSPKEVGVPTGRCGVSLKKKNGVKAFGLGAKLWGCQAE